MFRLLGVLSVITLSMLVVLFFVYAEFRYSCLSRGIDLQLAFTVEQLGCTKQ